MAKPRVEIQPGIKWIVPKYSTGQAVVFETTDFYVGNRPAIERVGTYDSVRDAEIAHPDALREVAPTLWLPTVASANEEDVHERFGVGGAHRPL